MGETDILTLTFRSETHLKYMDVILSKESIDLQESELLVTGFFQDERPLQGTAGWLDWRLNGRLSRFLLEKKLTGEWKEKTLIPSQRRVSPKWIVLFGLGNVKTYSYLTVREIVPSIHETIKHLNATHTGISLPCGEGYDVDCGKLAEVVLEGITDVLDQCPSDRSWTEALTLSFAEGEGRFSELLFGVQTAKSILGNRLPIRILIPSENRRGHG